jgi:DNA-3-methyladenine glycosylase
MILHRSYYIRENVVELARDLLGKTLYTSVNGVITAGIIVETEAYAHQNDRACHAHLQKRTTRTEVMFHTGGVAYVYLVYGIHYLFNIITNVEGKADAVLVRAVEPVKGQDVMGERRNLPTETPMQVRKLTSGPGKLSKAMGISKIHYGLNLSAGKIIWIADEGVSYRNEEITTGPRIGIDYAGEDARLPWRFWVKGNRFVSR